MPPLAWLAAGLTLVLSVLALLASLLRAAIEHHSRARLLRARRRSRATPFLDAVLHDPEPVLLATEVVELALAAATLAAAFLAALAFHPEGSPWVALGTTILAGALLFALLLRAIPQPAVQGREERFLLRASRLRGIPWGLLPRLGARLEATHRLVLRLRGLPAEPSPMAEIRDEIRSAIESGERDGLLESRHGRMIERVLRLREADASEIMTPRMDMVAIEATRPLREAVALAVEKGLSRLPAYEGTQDHVIGILNVKDVLPFLAAEGGEVELPALKKILRSPEYVHEAKPVGELLEEFLARKNHFAIVLDEYGGTAGLVTLEDVLEEIVGEIRDEHDRTTSTGPELRVVEERAVEISARLPIAELNLALDIRLPRSEDFDTAGGFVVAALGRVPKPGETFVRDSVEFRVLDADERRVKRLRVRVLEPTEEQA